MHSARLLLHTVLRLKIAAVRISFTVGSLSTQALVVGPRHVWIAPDEPGQRLRFTVGPIADGTLSLQLLLSGARPPKDTTMIHERSRRKMKLSDGSAIHSLPAAGKERGTKEGLVTSRPARSQGACGRTGLTGPARVPGHKSRGCRLRPYSYRHTAGAKCNRGTCYLKMDSP